MLRTLLVPLDGSEEAERALPYAVRLAVGSGARVVLVRVALGPPPTGFDWERQQLAAVAEAETYLGDVAAKVGTRVPIDTSVPYGDAPTRIVQAVTMLGADAIVMASHGRTGLDHLLHGSVAEAVLAHSHVPVFVVHARADRMPTAPFEPSSARVLVPLDGSEFAEAALSIALQLQGSDGELILASVVAPPAHVEYDETGRPRAYLDQQEESLKRDALDYLRGVAAQLEHTNPNVRTAIDVRLGEPAAGIVMAEVDRRVDVVVMSTHGRTGLGRAVTGSVAGGVLRTGRVPVVLVGPVSALDAMRLRRPAAISG